VPVVVEAPVVVVGPVVVLPELHVSNPTTSVRSKSN
jgi:hypothetical protein